MTKLTDWQSRLIRFVGSAGRKPFEAGRNDCTLFAAGCVEAQTGVDFAADWRGRYTTLRGGQRMLRKAGYRDHVEMVERLFEEVPVAFAQPGDVAVLPTPDGPALGIVQGEAIYVLRQDGLALEFLLTAQRAFRVI